MKLKNFIKAQKVVGIMLLLTFMSCDKKDDNAGANSMNDITLSEQKISTPVAPKIENSGYAWFMLVGQNIFYSNHSNQAAEQFMLKYNIANNNFAEVTSDEKICACGYENKLISNGVNEIYYIANSAKKYSIETNVWSNLNYPASAYENNGECGQVHHNSKIYFLGGRTASKKFKCFNTTTEVWLNVADYTDDVRSSQMVSANNKIYALGGRNAEGEIVKTFGMYDENTNTWENLADLPFDLNTSHTDHLVADYNDKYILVLQNNNLQIYDINNNMWKDSPLNLAIEEVNFTENIFTSGSDIYVTGLNSVGDFSLYKITLENVPD